MNDEIVRWSALTLSRAIRAREVSCEDVMAAFLARIDRFNPRVNALVSLQDRDDVMRQARTRDDEVAAARRDGRELPWMHGFPQAPKDLTSVAGLVTTSGSPVFADFVPKTDSILVERLRKAGSVFIGRTNVPEFGLGSHTYNQVFGTTLNAYDQTRSAGGSSGGAAVALALDMLPVADGSDFMGSLRNPAGWNNVFGFRPSMGRVPNGPAVETFLQQMGTEGPMARTVSDLAMMLSTIAGHDARAPLSLGDDPAVFAEPLDADLTGTRVGWLGDFDGHLPMEDGVMATCARALAHVGAIGGIVDDARVDFDMDRLWHAWVVTRNVLNAGKARALYDDPRTRPQLSEAMTWEIERGLAATAMDLHRASVDRTAWHAALLALFERFDILLLPTAQVFPFAATLTWPTAIAGRAMDTYHRWMEVVIGATFAGLPALSVPAGFGPQGLPMGLQVVGPPRADLAVLRFGHAYEAACGYSARRSPLLTER